MNEIWRPIIGYEGIYEVSSQGNIKRIAGGNGATPGRILKSSPWGKGYQSIMLSYDNKAVRMSVHRIVAETFLGCPPQNYQVNHKNGDKSDNRVENLEWVSPSKNMQHAFQVLGIRSNLEGKGKRGEKNNNSKLTAQAVKEIRSLYSTGRYSQSELARRFEVHRHTIGSVVQRKTWSHV